LDRILIGLGLLMLIAGLAAIGLGLPYILLERGFTQVIVGTSVATSGLVLSVLGFVLRDLRSLRASIAGMRAQAAVDLIPEMPVSVGENAAIPDVPASDTAALTKIGGMAGLAVAGAGAAVLAGGVALAGASTAVGVSISGNGDGDVDLPPPDIEIPQTDLYQVELQALPLDAAAEAHADDLSAKIDLAVDDLASLRRDLRSNLGDADTVKIEDSGSELPLDVAAMTQFAEPADQEIGSDFTPQDLDGTASDQGGLDEVASGAPDEDIPDAVEIASAPDRPVISDEGIVGVHTVGASTFTMYSDGTIRAETPDGPMQFPDVAALKDYLASERTA
jgi:hypothetical protein